MLSCPSACITAVITHIAIAIHLPLPYYCMDGSSFSRSKIHVPISHISFVHYSFTTYIHTFSLSLLSSPLSPSDSGVSHAPPPILGPLLAVFLCPPSRYTSPRWNVGRASPLD